MQWRRHQSEAFEAIERAGGDRHWVVMPPGAGKTLLGAEVAKRWGRPVVVFAPNVAIVAQWRATWESLTGDSASSDRALTAGFTALTYQSLAVFDAEVDAAAPLSRLHRNGVALVERLHELGPVTIILDECHHLLEVWGDLLDQVIGGLPDAKVLALTATPPDLMSAAQEALVGRLFGQVTYEVGIPALVAEGDLAPFMELAWFTEPSTRENEWLDTRARRSDELIGELTRVDVVDVPLLSWLSLHDFVDFTPEVADAVIRLALDGAIDLPEAAQVAERHRRGPSLEDWLQVASGWLLALTQAGSESQDFVTRMSGLLPGVGFRWTRNGIKPGQPLVDRVLSRSSSKALAAVEIVAGSLSNDPQARVLVLTDFATASALPADLDGVVEPESGSARWVLEALLGDDRLRWARPIAVTGSSIGADASVLRELLPDEAIEGDGLVVLEGNASGRWLQAATDALNRGWTRCVVGTRGLLGEGWDARSVTGVVDLTTATTATAIVQTRGRSLRHDPHHPDKVAVNWTVTCVAGSRPQGDSDYQRLVRKHSGWFAVDEEGDVVDGVAHLDSQLSPDAAPTELSSLNARSQLRSSDVDSVRSAWDGVDPRRCHPSATLRIRGTRAPAAAAVSLPMPQPKEFSIQLGWWAGSLVALVLGLAAPPVLAAALWTATAVLFIVGGFSVWKVGGRRFRAASAQPSTSDYARAVAGALHAAGMSPVGAEGVVVEVTATGEQRVNLVARLGSGLDIDEETTERFTQALSEVLSPIARPRYVINRAVWRPRSPTLAEVVRLPQPDAMVWHQVPAVFGASRKLADVFAAEWQAHVWSGGQAVFTGTPEGTGIVAALRWSSPFGDSAGLELVQRRQW